MTTTKPLCCSREGAVELITINDPPYNRMTLSFIDQLAQEVERIAADETIRAVVLTAEGLDNFSVGMNLKQLPEGISKMGSADALLDQRLDVISAIENMGKPWVVTLFGYCLGGGLEIPLGCHFRLAAAQDAQIGLPEMDLGTVPGWGGSARLTRCIGSANAIDMILRSKKINGPEAYRIGLVHEVWPLLELKDKALQLAQQLADQPANAVHGMLKTLVNSEQKSIDQLLLDERQAVKDTLTSPDAQEGMAAFLEKRPPVFNR